MSNFRKAVSMLLAVAMILSMVSMVAFADETDPSAAPAEAVESAAPAPEATAATTEVQTSTTDQEAADAVVGSAAGTTIANLPNDDVTYSQDYNFDYGLGLFELLPDGY